ncbi:MAG: PAS domain S-box protein [Calditrichaeota bacterium]|nr:MAG: PAS domain S-box protein [Calditrichota bacterium]
MGDKYYRPHNNSTQRWKENMNDQVKTKAQLIAELATLRHRIVELEKPGAENRALSAGQTEEKKLYKWLADHAKAMIYRLSLPDGHYEFVSPASEELFGYSPEEFYDSPSIAREFIHPEWKNNFKKEWTSLLKGEMPPFYEYQIIHKSGEVKWLHQRNALICDEAGKPAAIEGFVTDITERVQAEEALRKNKERLLGFMNSATDGFILFDSKLNYVDMNKTALEMTGLSHADIQGKNIIDIVPDIKESGRFAKYKKVIKTGKALFIESCKSHEKFDSRETEIRAFKVGDGLGIIMRDITNRKKVEGDLKIQAEILNNMAEGVNVTDGDGIIRFTNARFDTMFGYKRGKLIGKQISKLNDYRSQKNKIFIGEIIEVLREKGTWSGEIKNIRKDGSKFISFANISGLHISGTEYWISVQEDITERKRIQETLQENEIKLRAMFENSRDAIGVSKDGIHVMVNPAYLRMFGYDQEDELIGKPILNCIAPAEHQRIINYVHARAGDKNVPNYYETRGLCKDGHEFDMNVRVSSYKLNGEEYTLVILRNITESKQAHDALRESENRLHSIFRVAPVGIGLVANRTIMEVNEKVCEMVGYSNLELVGKSARILYPTQEDFEYVGEEKYRQIRESGTGTVETQWQRKDGKIINVLLSSTPLEPDNLAAGITFSALNISKRLQTEKALRRSEKLLKEAQQIAKLGGWEYDVAAERSVWTDEIFKIYGIPKGEALFGDKSIMYYHPDDRETVLNAFIKAIKDGVPYDLEVRFINHQGEELWVRIVAKPILKHGKVSKIVGNMMDITERKTAEQTSRLNEDRLSKIMIAAKDGMWDWNLETNEVYFDPRYYKLAGYAVDEFPHNFDEFYKRIHPDDAHAVMQASQSHLSGESERFQVEFRFKKKNNDWLWILGRGFIVERDADNKPLRFVGTHTDITIRKLGERKLRESEEKFRMLADHTYDWEYWINPEGEYIYLSPACERITGYSPEKFTADPDFLFKLVKPEYSKQVIQHFKIENNKDAPVFTMEFPIITKSGAVRWLEHNCNPVYDENGKYVGRRGNNRDITERKHAAEKIRESEEKFRTLFNKSPDILTIQDSERRIIEVNNAAVAKLGYSYDELINMSISEIQAQYSPEELLQISETVIKKGHAIFESVLIAKNRTAIPVEINASVIDFQGKQAVLTQSRDITERKQAGAQLKLQAHALNSAANAILITNANGSIQWANPAFCQLTGYTLEESLGQNPRVLKSGQHDNSFYQNLWERISSGKVWRGEICNKHKNGELYSEEMTIAPLRSETGEISNFIAIKQDITKRKKAEVEKSILEKQLRRAQKLETIGTLAGGIAHDFNNILTPILGYTEMAVAEMSDSVLLKKDLKRVLDGAYRAKDLVEQILLFSKQVEKERNPLSLHLILKEALKLLRPSIPTTVNIVQRIDPGCDKIMADATQLHQVIINLCTNAWHAMEESGGTLTIELKQVKVDSAMAKMHPNLQEVEYVRLTVRDTGQGMDEAILERIFEPFYTTKAVDKGTGLGLSVVHGIVHNHKGEILVNSEPGVGTVFQVYLPAVKSDAVEIFDNSDIIKTGNETILVVDDDIAVGKMIKRMLQKLGYTIDLYQKSEDALAAFQSTPNDYDLVISDLTMPDLTGVELSERIQLVQSGTPILIITGFGEKMLSSNQNDRGIIQVIEKPIIMTKLASAIREAVKTKQV